MMDQEQIIEREQEVTNAIVKAIIILFAHILLVIIYFVFKDLGLLEEEFIYRLLNGFSFPS